MEGWVQQLEHAEHLAREPEDEERPYHHLYAAREVLERLRGILEAHTDAEVQSEARTTQALRSKDILAVVDLRLGAIGMDVEEPHIAEKHLRLCIDSTLGQYSHDEQVQMSFCNKIKDIVGIEPLDIQTAVIDPVNVQRMISQLNDIIIDIRANIEPLLRSTMIRALGRMGIICSQRGNAHASILYLLAAESLYDSANQWYNELQVDEQLVPIYGSVREVESAHTHTLFYLAQAYGNIQDDVKSATYCHLTLQRQLATGEFTGVKGPVEWITNCLHLSDYFRNKGLTHTCAHCLMAAEKARQSILVGDEEDISILAADTCKRWTKLFLYLLTYAREFESDSEAKSSVSEQELSLPPLNIEFDHFALPPPTRITYKQAHSHSHTFEDARELFLLGNKFCETALKVYVLDGFVSEHVKLKQDQSKLYLGLAFFEPELKRSISMHQRRADMLSSLVTQLNVEIYIIFHKELSFEAGEACRSIAEMKRRKMSQKSRPSRAIIESYHEAVESGISLFSHFTNLFAQRGESRTVFVHKEQTNRPDIGTLVRSMCTYPDENNLHADEVRPWLLSHMHICNLLSKHLGNERMTRAEMLVASMRQYQWLVDFAPGLLQRKKLSADVFAQELSVCAQMLELMPAKVDKVHFARDSMFGFFD